MSPTGNGLILLVQAGSPFERTAVPVVALVHMMFCLTRINCAVSSPPLAQHTISLEVTQIQLSLEIMSRFAITFYICDAFGPYANHING